MDVLGELLLLESWYWCCIYHER